MPQKQYKVRAIVYDGPFFSLWEEDFLKNFIGSAFNASEDGPVILVAPDWFINKVREESLWELFVDYAHQLPEGIETIPIKEAQVPAEFYEAFKEIQENNTLQKGLYRD